MRVELLARVPQFTPLLVDAFIREWPDWARSSSRTEIEKCFECRSDSELPLVLVAHDEDRLLGTVALRPWFADEHIEQTPWVRGLLVLPEFRGRGIDRVLYAAVEELARSRGDRWMHAATTNLERLLVRRGWEVFHRFVHGGRPMAWLRKSCSRRNRR